MEPGAVVGAIGAGVRHTHQALANNYRSVLGLMDTLEGREDPIDMMGSGTHSMLVTPKFLNNYLL